MQDRPPVDQPSVLGFTSHISPIALPSLLVCSVHNNNNNNNTHTCVCLGAGEIANNRESEAQIVFYEREMARARELQAQEGARLEELLNHVDLMQATLSKAANDLAGANNNTAAARQELETRK